MLGDISTGIGPTVWSRQAQGSRVGKSLQCRAEGIDSSIF